MRGENRNFLCYADNTTPSNPTTAIHRRPFEESWQLLVIDTQHEQNNNDWDNSDNLTTEHSIHTATDPR